MLSKSAVFRLLFLDAFAALSSAALTSLTLPGPATLPADASPPLHPSLASFSIETAFFIDYTGNISSPNILTKNLLENLKNRTGVPAEIRIGGITADSTYWDASLDTPIFNFIDDTGALQNTTIGPQFWDVVRELLPEGTKITVNLNLQDLNFTGALEVARSAVEGLPAGQLVALEIGNEPDHYLSFTPQNYTGIWRPWSVNVSDALNLPKPFFQLGATAEDPLFPFNTPTANRQLDCVSALAAGANDDGTVKYCSEHTYQYSVCDPARAAVATLRNLVNHTRVAQYLDLWQPRVKSVREQLGPDSFVIDTTFYAASNNVSRLYIHQGGPLALQSSTQLNHGGLSLYDLWWPVDNQNGPTQVFPHYSAYLFVTETLGTSKSLRIANIFPGRQENGSSITTALGDESQGQLVVYGFWDESLPSGRHTPSKLALLNLEAYNSTEGERPLVSFNIGNYLPSSDAVVTVRRLQAPGIEVKTANLTTWAGQTFESGVASGELKEEKISGGVIEVEASGAVLVSIFA
ncbi:hypothetical protein D9758_003789 [Tetrapyrgos nigripes]|uniref:Beta-glucuronidase C-terminal domain-containing protein n=1 Tax=Tetrapyrgos nigripes TaxID=182062 RepID=A0A8H5LS45_9AGAR|nr:hypothetical protein D9758_003789 [Tetrapyrgos nigripes]